MDTVKKRMTNAQIEEALVKTAGNISQAARELGVSRSGLYKRIAHAPKAQQVLTDSRESLVDIAESALLRGVIDGNMTAIIWTLKASPAAKARGWSERQEVTGAVGTYAVTKEEWEKARAARQQQAADVMAVFEDDESSDA